MRKEKNSEQLQTNLMALGTNKDKMKGK